jgi:hypothetical protein
MIPWRKLPKDLQRAILATILLSSEAAAASSCAPMVCDPPPPPSMTPTLTPLASPIICDPVPPPPTATRTPTASPTPTAASTVTPTATLTPARPPEKTPMIFDPPPDPPMAPDSGWMGRPGTAGEAHAALPLAEIRTVSIYWDDGDAGGDGSLRFEAASPWQGALYRWSTSGGTLGAGAGGQATWQPPAEPGRYLLQVVADWGATGMAVDALVLVVGSDGSVTVA